MADAESKVENNNEIEFTEVEVLRAGHHGSNTSSSEKFIQKVSPEIVIISVGDKNIYKHPASNVVNRLEKASNYLLRTDKDGTIYLINIDGVNHIEKLKTSVNGSD